VGHSRQAQRVFRGAAETNTRTHGRPRMFSVAQTEGLGKEVMLAGPRRRPVEFE
jgi:hypothetical protein